jgi:hypothetical protein
MTKRNLLAALAAMLPAWSVYAVDYVWLIGGGLNPDSSQGQIELNVNWVVDILRTKARKLGGASSTPTARAPAGREALGQRGGH